MAPTPVTCIIDAQNKLGEGCMWDAKAQSLWWLDIKPNSSIHRLVPATGESRVWNFNVILTNMALKNNGTLLVGGEHGLYHFDPVTGVLPDFVQPETTPGNRGNDGAADAKGRFWHGTMQNNIGPEGEDLDVTRSSGALYKVEADGASTLMLPDVGISNGPCWTADSKTFYFSDSRAQIIWAFDFDVDAGRLSNRRVHSDTKDYGYPDGATVDADGFLWSARWEASCVLRIDPKGRIDRVVAMPATRPTCVCFGGPNLDVMYVTSSRAHVSDDVVKRYPFQGGVFCFDPKTKGFAKHRFGG